MLDKSLDRGLDKDLDAGTAGKKSFWFFCVLRRFYSSKTEHRVF